MATTKGQHNYFCIVPQQLYRPLLSADTEWCSLLLAVLGFAEFAVTQQGTSQCVIRMLMCDVFELRNNIKSTNNSLKQIHTVLLLKLICFIVALTINNTLCSISVQQQISILLLLICLLALLSVFLLIFTSVSIMVAMSRFCGIFCCISSPHQCTISIQCLFLFALFYVQAMDFVSDSLYVQRVLSLKNYIVYTLSKKVPGHF